MKNKKKTVAILLICIVSVILIFAIGYAVLVKLNVFMTKAEAPPLLYVEDAVWKGQMVVGSLPQKTYYIGKIKKSVSSTESLPKENFTTNCPFEDCNVYKAELSETVYIEYKDENDVTRYAIYKKLDD